MKDGSRHIDLLIPVEVLGRRVEFIRLAPFRYSHTMRWEKGQIGGPNDLLVELAGETIETLGELCYPDADIVLQEFMAHIPASVRDDIVSGNMPVPRAPVEPNDSWGGDTDSVDGPGPSEEQPNFGGLGMDLGYGGERT